MCSLKFMKKQFRKMTRRYSQGLIDRQTLKLNTLFHRRNMSGFWNELKLRQHKRNCSSLGPTQFADYISEIMKDCGDLNLEQSNIHNIVNNISSGHSDTIFDTVITSDQVDVLIDSLHCNTAAGPDGVYTEHLKYGKSNALCKHLASIFTTMLQYSVIPSICDMGIIVILQMSL